MDSCLRSSSGSTSSTHDQSTSELDEDDDDPSLDLDDHDALLGREIFFFFFSLIKLFLKGKKIIPISFFS